MAVKILLNTALDVYSEEAVKQALTLSNPVLENLQKVREGLSDSRRCMLVDIEGGSSLTNFGVAMCGSLACTLAGKAPVHLVHLFRP